MPLFQKPQFNSVWASTGAKLTPDVAKISQGWWRFHPTSLTIGCKNEHSY